MKRLRGINIGGWLSQLDAIKEKDPDNFSGIDAHIESFITEKDFLQVKEWGFNHVRLPIDYYLFFDENANPYQYRLKYLDLAVRLS